MAKNVGPWVWRKAIIHGRNAVKALDEQNGGRIPNLFWEHIQRTANEYGQYSSVYLEAFHEGFWSN